MSAIHRAPLQLRLASMCVLLAAVTACADISALLQFQRALAAEFGTSAINVNVSNGSHIVISFINAPQASMSGEERADFALRVAEFVRDRYPSYEKIQNVDVAFTSQSSAGPLSVSRTDTPYRFTRSQLGEPMAPKPSA